MKMARKFFKLVENTVRKGEIACYEQFLLIPAFSKDLYCRYLKKAGLVWERVNCRLLGPSTDRSFAYFFLPLSVSKIITENLMFLVGAIVSFNYAFEGYTSVMTLSFLYSRCNVVINFFENAHKVSVSEDSCEDCGSNLLEVDFSKVGRSLTHSHTMTPFDTPGKQAF